MKTVYAATHIRKYHAEQKCDVPPERRECMLDVEIDLIAGTLADLLIKLGFAFQVELTGLYVDHAGTDTRVRFFRLEDGDGNPPDAEQLRDWQRGNLPLFRAEYAFTLERRRVVPILLSEFEAIGVLA